MELIEEKKPTRSYWIISIVALVWNLMGVASYLMSVSMSPEALAALPEAERALYADIPVWATSAFAIAVFGGTLGCILLLMRKALAIPVFMVSLVGIVVQMIYGLFMSGVVELRGVSAAIMPVVVIAVAVYLITFSNSAKKQGLIR